MSFLVIEGLDGSGKSTQVEMLKKHLKQKNIPFKYLHFPRLEEGIHGKLIARFLRGEFGENNQVDPYLVALLFAGDRMEARDTIEAWLDDGNIVLVDRFVYSNIAFQCAKLTSGADQEALADWILHLEFEYNKLPVPDMNIFLDVPFSFTKERLTVNREGGDREYLKGQQDIHEQDLDFQSRVREIYLSLVNKTDNIEIIECADDTGNMMLPDDIFKQILNKIVI